jgi:hypothetical protein
MIKNIYLIEYNNKIIGTYLNYNMAKIFILSCLQNNLMHNYAKILIFKSNSSYYLSYDIIKLPYNKVNDSPKELSEDSFKDIFQNSSEKISEDKSEKISEDKSEKISEDKSEKISEDKSEKIFENKSEKIFENKSEKILEDKSEKIFKNKIIDNNQFLNILEKKQNIQHNLNLIKYNKDKYKEAKSVYDIDIQLFEKFNIIIKNNPSFIIPELFHNKFLIFKQLKEQNNLTFDNYIKLYNKDNEFNDYFPLNDYENSFIK